MSDSPTYQVMPDLSAAEYEELKADIALRGVMVPIEFDEHGNVLDGHHRLRACEELGITDYPDVIRADMSEDEKRFHARKLNMARRHLTQEQRRDMIREQLSETPEKSDRQIAAGLGVDHKTVGAQRADLVGCGEIPHVERTVDTLGREQPRKPLSVFNPTTAEKQALVENAGAIAEKLDSGVASDLSDARFKVEAEKWANTSSPPLKPVPTQEEREAAQAERAAKTYNAAISAAGLLEIRDDAVEFWQDSMLDIETIDHKLEMVSQAMENFAWLKSKLYAIKAKKSKKGGNVYEITQGRL